VRCTHYPGDKTCELCSIKENRKALKEATGLHGFQIDARDARITELKVHLDERLKRIVYLEKENEALKDLLKGHKHQQDYLRHLPPSQ